MHASKGFKQLAILWGILHQLKIQVMFMRKTECDFL